MRPAPAERGTELGEPGECGYDPDAGNGAARRGAREKLRERGNSLDEEIAIVEARPGRNDEHQTSFEEIRGEQQAGDERDGQPPDSLPARRSARARTSR
jgi:hypothetical protein